LYPAVPAGTQRRLPASKMADIEALLANDFQKLSTTDFDNVDTELDGDVRQAPYVGDKSVKPLADKGVKSIWQLFGKYLELGRDDEKFKTFLREAGVNASNCGRVTEAISKRMLKLGFVVKVPLPPDLAASSRVNDTQITAFVNKKLPQDLEECFIGIGENTGKVLKAADVKSTDELFAKLLSFCDEPKAIQPDEKMRAMYIWMKEAGVTGGWIASVIDQLSAKLRVGIDSGVELDPTTGDR